jgi:hypothetical protein
VDLSIVPIGRAYHLHFIEVFRVAEMEKIITTNNRKRLIMNEEIACKSSYVQ